MSDADKPEDDLTPEVHDEDDERTRLIAADPSIEVAPADPSSPPAPMPSSPSVPEGSEATDLQPVPAPTRIPHELTHELAGVLLEAPAAGEEEEEEELNI